VDRVLPLRGRIRCYAWGSRTALAELLGEPSPAPAPQAELWLGAHPASPACVCDGDAWIPLPEWIARDPEAVLGRASLARFGPELPFLLKVLAAERPLSIQVHPGAERAAAGFERESRAGVPLDAPTRSYRDPRGKTELVCARSSFDALCGLRAPADIAADLEALRIPALRPVIDALSRTPVPEALRGGVEAWLTLPPDAGAALADAAAVAARAGRGEPGRGALLLELAALHPKDPGILAPCFLHRVELPPGEALYLPPGRIHAYLRGVAVELQASSDNVLRAGLTEKHRDPGELLASLELASEAPEPRTPRRATPGEGVYETPAAEFALAELRPAPGRAVAGAARRGVEILLCTEGAARIVPAGGGNPVPLPRGAAALVPAACAGYRVEGDALVHRAGVPG